MPQVYGRGKSMVPTAEGPGLYASPDMYARQLAGYDSLGRRIAAMSDTFLEAGIRLDRTERADAFAQGQLDYENMYNEHLAGQLQDGDYAGWPRKYDEAHKKFTNDYLARVKHAGARADLARQFEKYRLDNERIITVAAARRKTAEAHARLPLVIDHYVRQAAEAPAKQSNTIRKQMESQFAGMVANGTINKYELAASLEKFDADLEPVRDARIFANAANYLKTIPTREKAETYIDNVLVGALSSAQRNDLHAIVKRRFDGLEAQSRRKELQDVAKAEEEVWDIARTGDVSGAADKLDDYFTDRLVFSDGKKVADWKSELLSRAHTTANNIRQDKSNPYTTRQDDKAYWDMFNKVRDYPDSVTDTDLRAGVGKSWTINDYKELQKLKYTEDDPVKSPQAKRYMDTLANLIIGTDTTPSVEKLKYYDGAARAMRDWIKKNPDATPEQMSKFYNALIKPYMADWWTKNWENLYLKLPQAKAAPAGAEPRAGRTIGQRLLDIEPASVDDFEFEIRRISQTNKDLARQYYEKWKSKW